MAAEGETSKTKREAKPGAPLGWKIASIVAFPYFITNLVMVLNATGDANGTIWLPSFPAWYYSLKRIIEIPFGWYLTYMQTRFGGDEETSYQWLTWATRLPFVGIALAIFITTALLAIVRRRRAA